MTPISIEIPALIRALEMAREEFKTDWQIHELVEKLSRITDRPVRTDDLKSVPIVSSEEFDRTCRPR